MNTSLAGIELKSCITNASGVLCTTKRDLLALALDKYSGAVVTKSCTLQSRKGNPLPRYYEDELGSINSNGLCNEGYLFYIGMAEQCSKYKPYIISICGLTMENTKTMLSSFNNQGWEATNQLIELNISCPNIVGCSSSSVLGWDFQSLRKYLVEMREILPDTRKLGLKCPPYYYPNQFEELTEIINEFNIGFITCCNSIPNGLFIDTEHEMTRIKPKNGLGGINGSYIKPISLSNVYQFHNMFTKYDIQCDIVGCGGIKSGSDVFDYILAGASVVQVGTQLMKEQLPIFKRLYNETIALMEHKSYNNIHEYLGKLKVKI